MEDFEGRWVAREERRHDYNLCPEHQQYHKPVFIPSAPRYHHHNRQIRVHTNGFLAIYVAHGLRPLLQSLGHEVLKGRTMKTEERCVCGHDRVNKTVKGRQIGTTW